MEEVFFIKDIKILTEEEIFKQGTFCGDDIDFGGEACLQLCLYPLTENEVPVNGIVYGTYKNGKLKFYQNYTDGIKNGIGVDFYEDGAVKNYRIMNEGQILGTKYSWYENGSIKSVVEYRYGLTISYVKYSSTGEIIEEKLGLDDKEKKLYETFKRFNG